MKIICISGKAQAGKDTFATEAKEFLESCGYKVLITHFADLLKYICKAFFNWDGNKDEQGRHLLQYIGTDIIRKKMPDFWVEFIVKVMKLFPNKWDYVLIPDCRFENEIIAFKDEGFDITHIRIERIGFDNKLTSEQKNHPSEIALDNVEPDYWFLNYGDIDNYENQIDYFLLRTLGISHKKSEEI